jgi:hypothetical protein
MAVVPTGGLVSGRPRRGTGRSRARRGRRAHRLSGRAQPDPAGTVEHAGGQVTTRRAAANAQAQPLAGVTTVRDVGSDATAEDVVTAHEQSGAHGQR